jgi:preprotein translocase subunit SecG
MLHIFFQVIQFISAILLVLMVLMLSPKSEGLGAIGGRSHVFQSSVVEKGLYIITATMAILFLVASALLGWNIV